MNRKIYLIQPTYRDREGLLLQSKGLYIHSLAIPALLAAVPPDWRKEYCLECFSNVDFNTDASVVGISSMGYDIVHGREIAEEFKRRGKLVIFGGHQAPFSREWLAPVMDSLVNGNPGPVWMKRILDDAEAGCLRQEYHCGIDMNFPFEYSVLAGKGIHVMPVVSSIGCRNQCEFCSSAARYRGRYWLRRIENVIQDLKAARKLNKKAGFVDSNIYNNREYTVRLCSRIVEAGIRVHWGAQSTIDVGGDDEALRALRKAGCRLLFIGLETTNQMNMALLGKRYSVEQYRDLIRNIKSHGIGVAGYFMLGLDEDTVTTFDTLYDFIQSSKIDVPILNLLLPSYGTPMYDRLKAEGRLLVDGETDFLINNPLYNAPTNRCFYLPKRMSPAEAERGFAELGMRLSSIRNVVLRSLSADPVVMLFLLFMNLDNRKDFQGVSREMAQQHLNCEL